MNKIISKVVHYVLLMVTLSLLDVRNEKRKCVFYEKRDCVSIDVFGECEIEEFGEVKWRCDYYVEYLYSS